MNLVSVKNVDTNVVALEVTVGAEEFKPVLEGVFRKNSAQLNIPGFRKGKAPRAFVEKQYGDYFIEEAVNKIYPSMYEQAALQADIKPVDKADVEIKDVSAEGFSFTATVTVKPSVEVKKYKGLSATKTSPVIDDAEVEDTLSQLRDRAARLVTVEDRAAAMGDTVNIDFDGYVGGVAFDGGKSNGFDLVLGSGQFIPGFEEQIVGKKIDESFDVNVQFPSEYHSDDLAGKDATFKCKLNGIKIKELPELDDEFVKDVSEFDTIAELKADIKSTLTQRAQQKCDEAYENELVSAVIENTVIDLPQCMIERRIDEMIQDFDYRLQSQGMNIGTYMQYTGDSMETFRKTFAEQAERHVRIRLALEKIVEMEKIEANDDDLNKEYARLAKLYEMEEEKLKGIIPIGDVYADVTVSMAIDLVRDNSIAMDATDEVAKKKPAVKKTAAKKTENGEEAAEKPAPKKTAAKKKKAEEPAE